MSAKNKEKKEEKEQVETAEATTVENNQEQNENAAEEAEELSEAEVLQQQLAEANDKYLRLYSEFDNYRKRTLKEKIDLSKRAGAEIFQSLLPVLDDFERAMDNIRKSEDVKGIEEGVELIYNKLFKTMEQKGVKAMDSAKGNAFDDEMHEAITTIPAPEDDLKGKVVDEVERGYYLHDTILRYAKVVVGQ